MARVARAMVAASAVVALASCNIEEVTIPLGREVIVVQAVLTLDSAALAQYVVVERSLTGTVEVPDQDSLRGPPRPPVPVSGARVVVTREDGDSLVFAEIPDTLGVYRVSWTESLAFLKPGRVYGLRVVTPEGHVVRGQTRMPDPLALSGAPPDGATFNRDRDTLRLSWGAVAGTKGYFVQVRPRDVERRLTLVLFTDSTKITMAGALGLPFAGDDNPPSVWIAGTRQTLTVAAMDSNFFDFLRTGNDPFTGAGFKNALEGGLGVFGSMAPANRTYDVIGDVDLPAEGRYALSGQVNGQPLGGQVRLFVTRDRPAPVLVAALVDAPTGLLAPRAEAAGRIQDGRLRLTLLRDPDGQPVQQSRFVLNGPFDPAGTTTGTVLGPDEAGTIGSFTLTRLP